jgi:hypothetical protein
MIDNTYNLLIIVAIIVKVATTTTTAAATVTTNLVPTTCNVTRHIQALVIALVKTPTSFIVTDVHAIIIVPYVIPPITTTTSRIINDTPRIFPTITIVTVRFGCHILGCSNLRD